MRRQFKDLVDCILVAQRVSHNNCTYEVKIGSGMGMLCSGAISNVAFMENAEKDFAIREDVQRSFNVLYYARFMDDGFVIIGGSSQRRMEFWKEM